MTVATTQTQTWQVPWRDRAQLLRYGDLTLAEAFRHLARYGRGSRVQEADGLVLFAGGHSHPNPFRNGAIRLDHRLSAAAALERAQAFFTPLNRSFVFWVRESDPDLDELCKARGLQLVEPEGLAELALEGPPPPVPALDDSVVLRRAAELQVRRDYVDVFAEGWGMGGVSTELAADIFFHPDSVSDPNVIAFVAYLDGKPASGTMALLSHGIAVGVQGATAPWARRRGLAEATYAACLDVAYNEFGIRGSVCQSSPMGVGIWTRMGYREFTRFMRYVVRPAPAKWE
jgi:hypothetical protein